ncbi:unnamed protein product [Adineta ricciae]|uniref:TIR domain-containing protein n=1 Tax=Adineta ricciae TaxID=249248 RepID=A0A815KU92_ADIRI|nr:unnamed protein product [Adineta ricciae]CAF1621417.1 unnamed protein product [Adineta ricciae]
MRNSLVIHDEQFKPLCTWTPEDIQSFLRRCGVQQSSRNVFLEKQIDGYLFLSCTENELKEYFLMNDAHIRHDLIERVIQTIHEERQDSLQWHWTSIKNKGLSDHVYIIHHSEDSTMAHHISNYLKEKNFQVFAHQLHYGRSKHQFLALNGPILARAKYVIYILTKKSSCSIFPFLELTIAEWFEKSILTVYLENIWNNMRSTLRALLNDYPMVDFIHQSLQDGLATLYSHLPSQINASVCNQKQINKPNPNPEVSALLSEKNSRFVYVSYSKFQEKWNVMHIIKRLIIALEKHHFYTGFQVTSHPNTAREQYSCYLPKILSKPFITSYSNGFNQSSITSTSVDVRPIISSRDIRHCSIMIICLTPTYFHNELCLNELRICEMYQKPVLICLLRHMNSCYSKTSLKSSMNFDDQFSALIPARFSMTTAHFLRKSMQMSCVDLSTDDLFSRNLPHLLEKLETFTDAYQSDINMSISSEPSNIFNQISEIF